jgi:hypothetical protein
MTATSSISYVDDFTVVSEAKDFRNAESRPRFSFLGSFARKRHADSFSTHSHDGTCRESGRLFFEQPLHESEPLSKTAAGAPIHQKLHFATSMA